VSNRQDKLERNRQEAKRFVDARREIQLKVFEANFQVGLQLFEQTKDKMSPEEIELVEKEIEKNRALMDEIKSQISPTTEA
jgi:cob(I)alamin adenosyltransferase